MKVFISLSRLVLILLLISSFDKAQSQDFTHQDSLRGTITPERAWWDLTYYHLDIQICPQTKSIKGKNTIQYKVLEPHNRLQIDLQSPLIITKIIQDGRELTVDHDGNAHFVHIDKPTKTGQIESLDVYYEGIPLEAKNAPWDGGFSWSKDNEGNDFVATSCQGLGASVWWPNKDHMYDEVDSMAISINVPKGLMNISNGRLRKIEKLDDGTSTYHWFVANPINNYGVNANIGHYKHFSEVYDGENGPLDMDYYVLEEHLEVAKTQFKDATRMMEAFEYWFGPYPFYKDGYKLVEVPYLGMEHQSSVTYGNQFKNGYLGRDVSGSGWGLKFDFIIIHESAHEWFANNITNKDIADMWIHESFTTYAENLFVDYFYGKEAAADYVIGTRKAIKNESPIIGIYGVNKSGSIDMYNKGTNMLHTLRQLVNDDDKWRAILRGLNQTFYHKTVDTQEIEGYLIKHTGLDLQPFLDQYLRDYRLPILEYKIDNRVLKYRWSSTINDFNMSVKVKINETLQELHPTIHWKHLKFKSKIQAMDVDRNFYIGTKNISKERN